jgi:predicted nucleic acid-binding protein
MSNAEVKNHIQKIVSEYEVIDFSVAEILKAVDYKAKYKLSFYDSLIVTSAILSDCKTLYSEDLHHNLIVEKKLKVINPFK